MALRRLRHRFTQLDAHTREIVSGAVVALLVRIAGAGLTFAFGVVVARRFGAAGSGIYSLAFTVMTIASVIGRMGMDNTIVRYIAAHASVQQWGTVRAIHRMSLFIAIAVSVVTTIALTTLAPLLATHAFHDAALAAPIRWMGLATLPVVIYTLQSQALRALKFVASSVVFATVATPAIGTALLLLIGDTSRGPIVSVWSYCIAAVVTMILSSVWWRHRTPELRGAIGEFDSKRLLRTSAPLLWATSMSLAMNWIATFALGVWGTVADVGIFNAAARIATLVSFVLVAVDNISAPTFAALHAAGDTVALARTARNTVRLMLLLASPALLVVLAAPTTLLGLFGPEFVSGKWVLILLSISQAVGVLAGSVGSLLMMSGHERHVRDSNFWAALTCLVFALVLTPRLGALGAAIAVTVSLVVRNAYELAMVRKHLGIGMLLSPAGPASAPR